MPQTLGIAGFEPLEPQQPKPLAVASFEPLEPEPPKTPKQDEPASFLGRLRDVGISALRGAISVPESAVGLLDIPTGGRVGKALESVGFQPKQAKEILASFYTDQQKRANRSVEEADGFLDTAITALKNPSVIVQSVVESAPSMISSAGAARGLIAGGIGPLTAAAAGEGLVSAGAAASDARQPGGTLTAKQSALATASGAGTAALGRLGGWLAPKFGVADVDTLLAAGVVDAGARKGLVRAIVVGAVQEGGFEELPQSIQEQILGNISAGRPWEQGVDEAGVMGALAGAVMGGGAQVGTAALSKVTRPGAGTAEQPAAPAEPVKPLAVASFEPLPEAVPVPAQVQTAAPEAVPPAGIPPEVQPAPTEAEQMADAIEAAQLVGTKLAEETGGMRRASPDGPLLPAGGFGTQDAPIEAGATVRIIGDKSEKVYEVASVLDDGALELLAGGVVERAQVEPAIRKRVEGLPEGLNEGWGAAAGFRGAEQAQPQPKREYASSQFNLPEDVAKDVRALGEMIPDEDLAEDGRETDSHVTLKYGLDSEDATELREALKDQGPITVTLGKTSIFPASESGKADVVKIDVDSPQLHALNAKVAAAVDAPGDTHPSYKPHVTVAYVKPGQGQKYVGGDTVEGRQITLSEVTFTGKDGSRVTIPLTGQQQEAAAGPRTVKYLRNTEAAPNMGSRFGQDIEPAGRYVIEDSLGDSEPSTGWERGTVTFQKPLVVEWGGEYGSESNWKNRLSARYGGKTGKALSAALRADGYDGIITTRNGDTSEIVDLTGQEPTITRQAKPKITYNPGARTVEVVVPKRGGAAIRAALEGAGFRQRGKNGPWYRKTKAGPESIAQVEQLLSRRPVLGVESARAEAGRAPGEAAPSAGRPAVVRAQEGRAPRPEADQPLTRESAFPRLLERARAQDPTVDAADLRAEYDARMDMLDDLESAAAEDSRSDPRRLLRAIAKLGGIGESDMRGEIQRIKEAAGPFGSLAGVNNVFRKTTRAANNQTATGHGLDDVLTSLKQEPGFEWLTDANDLLEALDEATRYRPESDATFEDRLKQAGIVEGQPWWQDSWRAPKTEPTPGSFTVENVQEALGLSEEEATATVAVADAIGIAERLTIVKGGTPGSGAIEQAGQTDTPAFKAWFRESKVVDADGKPLVVHHGTARADRVGNRFRKSRATSGPMAFFTDNRDIAENYSKQKSDTSLEPAEDYRDWFQYKPKGARSTVNLQRAWFFLTPEQRATATERLPKVGYENADQAEGRIGHFGSSIMADDGVAWQLKESRGNALEAAKEIWLNSGSLFDQEERFMEVLDGLGLGDAGIKYASPHQEVPGVYDVYLSIQTPLDTSAIPQSVVEALDRRSRRQRPKQQWGADQWDKRSIGGQVFMERLRDDLKSGTAHAWTSIPDWVTDTLKDFGYDGIKDVGGKQGGIGHAVWIPFAETQVKSATGNRGTFDPSSPNILLQQAPPTKESVAAFVADTKKRLEGLAEFDVYLTNGGDLKLDTIAVRQASRGVGTQAMEALNAFADQHNVRIILSLAERGFQPLEGGPRTTSEARLEKFYRGFGFVRNKGRNKDFAIRESMFRRPRVLFQDAAEPAPIFYSAMVRAVEAKMPARTSINQAIAIVEKTPGVKPEEVKWSGVIPWLQGLKQAGVTKAEVLAYLEENRVQVKEVMRGDRPGENQVPEQHVKRTQSIHEAWEISYDGMNPGTNMSAHVTAWEGSGWQASGRQFPEGAGKYRAAFQGDYAVFDTREDAVAWAKERQRAVLRRLLGRPTKFDHYQTPGGENYRELLLTLPEDQNRAAARHSQRIKELIADRDALKAKLAQATTAQSRQAHTTLIENIGRQIDMAMRETPVDPGSFRGGHFDEPNVLAHVRFNDRTDADGKKVLFIEEVQSDWHQKGRREGYKNEPKRQELIAKLNELDALHKRTPEGPENERIAGERYAVIDAINALNNATIPDAPFKTSWQELAMRRMVRYAAEHGYDRLAFTTGEMQNERYDLSKQVDGIRWETEERGKFVRIDPRGAGTIRLTVDGNGLVGPDPDASFRNDEWTGKRLDDVVGKDMADRILSSDHGDLAGVDLKVGGSGMRGFYDTILPTYLNKFGKQWGVKVGETTIKADNAPENVVEEWAQRDPNHPFVKKNRMPVHSFDITDRMRASVVSEGVPLFQGPRASIEFFENNTALIRGLENPNASSGIHEIAHAARRFLFDRSIPEEMREGVSDDDILTAEHWAGATDGAWDTKAEERFARGFERYMRDGRSPSERLAPIFAKFKSWLTRIYARLKGSAVDIEISPAMREVFDRLVTRQERLQQAEAEGDVSFEFGDESSRRRDEDVLDTGEIQARLPEAGAVRDLNVATPELDAPFSLSSEVSKATKGKQDALFQDDDARRRWHGRSVVDSVVYHSTPYEFDTFDYDDAIGPHFGTKSAALDRGDKTGANVRDVTVEKMPADVGSGWEVWVDGELSSEHATKAEADKAAKPLRRRDPMAVWIRIEKPLRMPDMGMWGFGAMLSELQGRNLMTAKQGDAVWAEWQKRDALGWKALREHIESKGYDGIVYTNDVEDKGSTSFIPLRPEQIKSATGNRGTFDPSNPNILFQDDKKTKALTPQQVEAIATMRGLPKQFIQRIAQQAGYAIEPDSRPKVRPVSRPTEGREVPPPKPIAKADVLQFPSLQKLQEGTREEVAGLLVEYAGFQDQRRHVQPWKRTDALASDIWLPANPLKAGTALNAEELRAYQDLIEGSFQRRAPLLEKLKDGTASDWDKLEIARLTNQATVAVQSYRGAKTETGRAMNILKAQSRTMAWRESKFLEKALAAPGFNADLDAIAKAAVEAAGDPLKQLQFLRDRQGTAFDKLWAYYYANLLSGLKTQERNAIGNSFNVAANLVTPLGAVPADIYRVAVKGGTRSVYASELPHALGGAWVGTHIGLRNAWFTLVEGFRPSTVEHAEQGRFDHPRVEFKGGLKNPFNIPSRALEAADEFFRSIAYHQELYAGAFAQARSEGLSTGKAIASRMATLLAATDPKTKDGVTAARLFGNARDYAARAVMQEDPGYIVRQLLKLKSPTAPPGVRALATIIMPFMRISGNITRQGFEWSPAGFAMRGARSSDPRVQAQARGRALLGSALLMPWFWAAANGLLTGGPPDDEGEREEFYAQGKLGNAIRIGDTWVRYVLFQPYSVMMAAVATAMDIWESSQQDEEAAQDAVAGALAGGLASILDQSFLSGVSSAADALKDPKNEGANWLNLFVQGWVPLSGLMRNITQAVDPYSRKATGVVESAKTIIPGLSDEVPVRRNRMGEPVEPRKGSWVQRGFVVPEVSAAVSDQVTETLARLRIRPQRPDRVLQARGERVKLTREQEDVFVEALGRSRKLAIERVIKGSSFAGYNDETQERIIRNAMDRMSGIVRNRARQAVAQGEPFTLEALVPPDVWQQLQADQRAFQARTTR